MVKTLCYTKTIGGVCKPNEGTLDNNDLVDCNTCCNRDFLELTKYIFTHMPLPAMGE